MNTNQYFTESDWKLFRKKIAVWQEAYMENLLREYMDLLSEDGNASHKFWALEKRIKDDKRKTGVRATISRSTMIDNILSLIDERAITLDDLDGFSDQLKERVQYLMKSWEEYETILSDID